VLPRTDGNLSVEIISSITKSDLIGVSSLLIGWLFIALIVAGVLGIWFDPLDFLYGKLGANKGIAVVDPWYEVRKEVMEIRENKDPDSQLWVQARMENGYVYQGEFRYVSFPNKRDSRELSLMHAILYTSTDPNDDRSLNPIYVTRVIIDTSKCVGIEVIYTKN
jgi:hypothetical protein